MNEMGDTYCVCGRSSAEELWELIQDGFSSFTAAKAFAERYAASYESVARFGGSMSRYIDGEGNEGYAEVYYDVEDGKIA